jgi:quinol-cytochrome oxidoreductase complex cytochrome b subunit
MAKQPIRERTWYRSIFHPGQVFSQSEIYTSVVRHPQPATPRGRAMTSFNNFFLHIYPVKVPKEIVRTRSTLRLGFIATTLFAILFVSGMYLMFFYHAAPPDAYFDMHSLSTTVTFGQFVRNVHRWAAHLMVIVVFLHLMRVFYAGAYKAPRQFNWVIGVMLLVLTLLMSFTGYLLPWDQLSYWAITVGTNIAGYVPLIGGTVRSLMLGGQEIGAATLLRFYVLHIYFIPALMVIVVAIHIWRVRKDNFAVVDRRSEASTADEEPTDPKEVADVRP